MAQRMHVLAHMLVRMFIRWPIVEAKFEGRTFYALVYVNTLIESSTSIPANA